jgi:acyl-CoA hydrolase
LELQNDRLRGVRVHQMHALRERPCEYGDRLRHVSYVLSAATRQAFWDGRCDLVPDYFSEMPALLRRSTRCDIVLAAASPPDAHGYFSPGTNAEYVSRLIGHVPFFLEANERMPRTFGLNQIHESQILRCSEIDRPLVAVPPAEPDDRDVAIAKAILERVPARATLQVAAAHLRFAVSVIDDERFTRSRVQSAILLFVARRSFSAYRVAKDAWAEGSGTAEIPLYQTLES